MTTHADVAALELVDGYVRGELTLSDAQAFEAHFFACDECFAAVQAAERLRSAVHDASARGVLGDERVVAALPVWWNPAFTGAAAAALIFAVATGWLMLLHVPRLERQLASERQSRSADARGRETREGELRRLAMAAEPNVPVVIVQNTRAADAPIAIVVPAGAARVVLWIEAPSTARAVIFRLSIDALEIDGLTPNPDGALAVSIPAASLDAGLHVARLYRSGPNSSRIAEYHLDIVRPR